MNAAVNSVSKVIQRNSNKVVVGLPEIANQTNSQQIPNYPRNL